MCCNLHPPGDIQLFSVKNALVGFYLESQVGEVRALDGRQLQVQLLRRCSVAAGFLPPARQLLRLKPPRLLQLLS